MCLAHYRNYWSALNVRLQSHETKLVVRCVNENGRVRVDATCERIRWLISQHLRKIAVMKELGAWETLFQGPDYGHYW
jgi:hypothetical protein